MWRSRLIELVGFLFIYIIRYNLWMIFKFKTFEIHENAVINVINVAWKEHRNQCDDTEDATSFNVICYPFFDVFIFSSRDKMHVEWARKFIKVLKDLEAYVGSHHTNGIVWNTKVIME